MARKLYTLLILGAVPAAVSFGQDVGIRIEETARQTTGLNFFAALVAGLILALGIHLLLTTLSVALGVSMIEPEKKLEPHHHEHKSERHKKDEKGGSVVQKISNAFGVWTLITASIALFFAAWMGVELSGVAGFWPAAIMGLVIWGTFYIVMTALGATMVSSMVGSLYHTATSGLKGMGKTVGSVFGKSPETHAADSAEKIARSVRDEVFGDINVKKIRKELEHYVKKFEPMSPKQIRKQIEQMFDETELKLVLNRDANLDIDSLTARLETHHGISKDQAQHAGGKVKEAISDMRDEYESGKMKTEAGVEGAMEAAGMDRLEAQRTRERIEQYLRNTHREELSPEGIKRDIEKLLTEPKAGVAALKSRLSSVNKDTVTAVLEQRKDISHEKAESIADHIQSIFFGVKSKVEGTTESVQDRTSHVSSDKVKTGVESKLQNYMDSLGRPELQYEGIKDDLILLFHHPRAGADELIHRLKSMDRETFKAIVSSRKDMSEEDAERMVEKMESARDEVINRANKMKFAIEEKVTHAEQKLADATGEVRKATAAAAWWSVIAAVGSAAAAIGGGLLAVGT